MKYTCAVDIHRPVSEVVGHFMDPDGLYNWHPTLKSIEHLEGEIGAPGAKTRLTYQGHRSDMVITETIDRNELPGVYSATYEGPGVVNPCRNAFVDQGNGSTRWIMETEFKFSGFMTIMSLFMRGAFRRETQSSMERFKSWVEGMHG